MAIELLPFDPAAFLTDDESIVEYLTIAFESNDPKDVTKALGVVARARGGIETLARESEVILGGSDTQLGTVLKVMRALGVKLSASMVA
jgi:probable addiction module antidote protein